MILDDLDPERAKPLTQHLKHWADPWGKMPGEIKGGQVPLIYDHFIVTSQYHPDEIWEDKQSLDAIKRRFSIQRIEQGEVAYVIEGEKEEVKQPEFIAEPVEH